MNELDIRAADALIHRGSAERFLPGRRLAKKEEKQPEYHVQERHFGRFERQFPVPAGVNAAQIAATFKERRADGRPAQDGRSEKARAKNRGESGLM